MNRVDVCDHLGRVEILSTSSSCPHVCGGRSRSTSMAVGRLPPRPMTGSSSHDLLLPSLPLPYSSCLPGSCPLVGSSGPSRHPLLARPRCRSPASSPALLLTADDHGRRCAARGGMATTMLHSCNSMSGSLAVEQGPPRCSRRHQYEVHVGWRATDQLLLLSVTRVGRSSGDGSMLASTPMTLQRHGR